MQHKLNSRVKFCIMNLMQNKYTKTLFVYHWLKWLRAYRYVHDLIFVHVYVVFPLLLRSGLQKKSDHFYSKQLLCCCCGCCCAVVTSMKKNLSMHRHVYFSKFLYWLCYVIRSIVKNLLMWKNAPHKVNNIVKKFNNSLLLTSRSQTYRM